MKNIKGIFFDIGWTMMRPAYENWLICKRFYELVDADIYDSIPQERKHDAFFGKAYEYLNDHHRIDTEEDELEQFREFFTMVGGKLPELGLTARMIGELACSKVYDMENYVFFDDTIETLEALRGKYRLGIISDTWPSITRVLKHGGVHGYFDTYTYSFELGVFKPDPRMYSDALGKLGLDAAQTIFIDDIEMNLDGAADAGINPVQITVRPDIEPGGKYPQITKTSGILELL